VVSSHCRFDEPRLFTDYSALFQVTERINISLYSLYTCMNGHVTVWGLYASSTSLEKAKVGRFPVVAKKSNVINRFSR